METGIELIAQERNEQVAKHKRSVDQDVENNKNGQLSFAAAILSCPNPEMYGNESNNFSCPEGWDVNIWFKMWCKPYKERLIIAGALIAAEIDRLQKLNDE